MTFKEFISALFEKWVCKHEWVEWKTIHIWGLPKDHPEKVIYCMHCKKCGKFKKIKIG